MIIGRYAFLNDNRNAKDPSPLNYSPGVISISARVLVLYLTCMCRTGRTRCSVCCRQSHSPGPPFPSELRSLAVGNTLSSSPQHRTQLPPAFHHYAQHQPLTHQEIRRIFLRHHDHGLFFLYNHIWVIPRCVFFSALTFSHSVENCRTVCSWILRRVRRSRSRNRTLGSGQTGKRQLCNKPHCAVLNAFTENWNHKATLAGNIKFLEQSLDQMVVKSSRGIRVGCENKIF